ncbi:hypothetical protein AX17_002630 [Amanita inopinata Kibby_2008]|nr:hypothetical protein AX17_002630 [Amanita inopinata Kibby_2008]
MWARRCMDCVRKDWKARKREFGEVLVKIRRRRKRERRCRRRRRSVCVLEEVKEKEVPMTEPIVSSPPPHSILLPVIAPTMLLYPEPIDPDPDPDPNQTTSSNMEKPPDVSEPPEALPPEVHPPSQEKLTLRFPRALWDACKHLQFCQDPMCVRELPGMGDGEQYDRTRCLVCRARGRERRRQRQMEEEWGGEEGEEEEGEEGWEGEGIEEEKEEEELSDEETNAEPVDGARLCAVKRCSHIIPPKWEYDWDMCLRCRSCYPKQGWCFGEAEDGEKENGRGKKGKADEKGGMNGVLRSLPVGGDRCASLDCGMVIGGGQRESTLCFQCTRRKVREVEDLERTQGNRRRTPKCKEIYGPVDETDKPVKRGGSTSVEPTTTYPKYISLVQLLDDFKHKLMAFLWAQVEQARAQIRRAASSLPPMPLPLPQSQTQALFKFDGQFSIVTPTLDVRLRKAEVLRHMANVRVELGKQSRFKFLPNSSKVWREFDVRDRGDVNGNADASGSLRVARNGNGMDGVNAKNLAGVDVDVDAKNTGPLVALADGFAVSFVCVHSLPLNVAFLGACGSPVESPRMTSDAGIRDGPMNGVERIDKAVKKDIKGELDIITVADDSHCVLPGQRTLVRFRLGVVDIV